MNDAILEKLKEPPRAEADVVYVFVEIRKLLEREGKGKEAEFATLKFFCDWVMHVKLDRSGARKILSLLDAELSASPDPAPIEPDSELYQFVSLDRLREEMTRFYRDKELPDLWATDPRVLRECLRFYGNIVLDCPLVITGQGTTPRYIRQLALTKVVNKDEPPDKRCFLWEWSFEFSDGSTKTLTHTYSYASLTWNGSVPSTAVFGLGDDSWPERSRDES